MKTWYLTKNFLVTIYLSLNSLTVLTFDSKIDSYFLGTNQSFIYSVLSKDKRSLILKGLKKTKTNLFVKTKTDQFAFEVQFNKVSSGHLQVTRAKRNQTYKLLNKSKAFDTYEGKTSLLKVYTTGREEIIPKFN